MLQAGCDWPNHGCGFPVMALGALEWPWEPLDGHRCSMVAMKAPWLPWVPQDTSGCSMMVMDAPGCL